ncbi:MAG: hypothetical protein ACOC34_00070 [Thermotogota bacterium]
MKSNKWIFIFIIVFVGIAFVSWEFFVTSRMTLTVHVNYPQGISNDVGFEMRVYSERFEEEMIVYPQEESIDFSSLPFGDYFFEIILDDRLIMKEFHSFQSKFSIRRLNEIVNLDLTELASITSVNYKIVDPYLTVKWVGKYQGGYKPTEYLIRVNDSERILSVNYFEIDVLKELLEERDQIDLEIIPLTRAGDELLAFEYEIPIRFESVRLDIPDGFNIYDMSINVQEKRIPIDPYDPKISFPVIDLEENRIPFEIYYYEDRIYQSELNLSDAKETINIPEIPKATVTEVEIDQSTVTLHMEVTRDEEFLYNRFSHFDLYSDSFHATATELFTYNNDNTSIDITPFFDPDIKGKTLTFVLPNPPQPRLHITMYDEQMKFKPSVKVFSDSSLVLNGTITIDNSEILVIPEFTEEYTLNADFTVDEVHLIDVVLEDIYGQRAQQSKWISTSVPETTFFSECELSQEKILKVAWDPLVIYSQMELIVTDNYNIKRFYPESNHLEADLSGTLLREPLKVILKGFLNDKEYTAAVVEEIKSK